MVVRIAEVTCPWSHVQPSNNSLLIYIFVFIQVMSDSLVPGLYPGATTTITNTVPILFALGGRPSQCRGSLGGHQQCMTVALCLT